MNFYFSYFFITPTATYGNCFSFNYAANEESDYLAGNRHSSRTGTFFGLEIVINLEQSYYIGDGITQAAGARSVIHNVNNRPLVDENGIDLMPNTLTELALQVEYISHKSFYNSKLNNE